jgi:uncharacterized protein (TIGR03437 family)
MLKLFCIPLVAASAFAQPVYTLQTVAGSNPLGDGGPATSAIILNPDALITDSNGVIYISENQGRVRRIGLNGIITTVAGGVGAGGSNGDNGPAVQAFINVPIAMAVDATANLLYISDYQSCKLRRVNIQTGIITAFAGDGICRYAQDGSAATTSLYYPSLLWMDPQGRLLVVEVNSNKIRRIDTNGNISTIAGTGTAGFTADGGLAVQAQINTPGSLTGDSKGNIFFTDPTKCLIREIDAATGALHTVAGSGCGFSGDGGPPLSAQLNPSSILINRAGDTMYEFDAGTRIRQINLTSNLIVTYAGMGINGSSGDGGPANKAQLIQAGALAFAKDGSLLLNQNYGIRRIDPAGIISTIAGMRPFAGDGGSAPNAILSYPSYLGTDGKGGFIFNDAGNGRIRAVTSAGVISTIAGTDQTVGVTGDGGLATNSQIFFLQALTTDAAGNIYIGEHNFSTASWELRRITPAGVIDHFGNAPFLSITGLAVDPTQQFLYASDAAGNRIVRMDLATGATATTFAGPGVPGGNGAAGFSGDGGAAMNARFNYPGQLAVDAAGNVYVADVLNARVRKITVSGSLVQTIAGTGTNASTGDGGLGTAASISLFVGITADSAGNVFLSEGNRIRRVDAVTGIINTVAGGQTGGFAGDGGPALLGRFSDVEGMTVDSRGNVYFTDLLNHRVRVISPQGTTPFVTSIDTAGGFPDIAQNSWTEIKGANLGPPVGLTWGSAPEFATGNMPTKLGNISVTVNGKPAYIYYVSSTQINVLTPLDNTLGPVSIVVTNGANVSLSFTATLRAAAPSFLLLGSTKYDAAEHLNFTLLGPTAISIPGFSFTPAQAGETIVLFSTGFGLPTTALTAGSSSQSGSLPTLPTVQIGGLAATVGFAGVISPGLYQLNVTVPPGLASGDNFLLVSYAGLTSPLGVLLALQ